MKQLLSLATVFLLSLPSVVLAEEFSADIGTMSDFAFPASEMNPFSAASASSDMNDMQYNLDTAIVTQMHATNTGNTIISGVTGFNTIGEGAFQNASGLINLVQNSGNGVVIQNSMTVNLSMQ